MSRWSFSTVKTIKKTKMLDWMCKSTALCALFCSCQFCNKRVRFLRSCYPFHKRCLLSGRVGCGREILFSEHCPLLLLLRGDSCSRDSVFYTFVHLCIVTWHEVTLDREYYFGESKFIDVWAFVIRNILWPVVQRNHLLLCIHSARRIMHIMHIKTRQQFECRSLALYYYFFGHMKIRKYTQVLHQWNISHFTFNSVLFSILLYLSAFWCRKFFCYPSPSLRPLYFAFLCSDSLSMHFFCFVLSHYRAFHFHFLAIFYR